MRGPRQLPLILALSGLGLALWFSPTLAGVAAGIAIFLFGMLSLEQGFRTFTGGTLERLLKKSTDRLWKSLTFGALATTLTQSSSLVSVITISFLSAGLMGLGQGIGVVFGANLGTTSGAWLVAGFGLKVNISAWALPLLTFGVVLIFNRASAIKGLGQVLCGIGFLFLGIHYMKEGFEAYQHAIDLSRFAVGGLSGLLLYTLIGIVATVIMQSSHATLVLTITALAAGHLTYENALALSIGANVGTTITALIGAVGANIEGRRLAAAHLTFNLATGLIALVFIQFFLIAVDVGSGWLGIRQDSYTLKLALFHTLFNLTGIVIMVPLIPRIVDLLERRMPERATIANQPKFINSNMLEMPGAALEAARRELLRLFRRVFGVIAQVLNFEPAQLRRLSERNAFLNAPERIRSTDVDGLYLKTIKPLHGIIVDFLARVPVKGSRAQHLIMLRTASRQLVEAVKDAKHLQKNMVRYLGAARPNPRQEYLNLRAHLGRILQRLDELAESRAQSEDLELALTKLAAEIEEHDRVGNSRLEDLIRSRLINAEQATSLMNDSAYCYRISRSLLGAARGIFLPFDKVETKLREQLSLDGGELPDQLMQGNAGESTQTKP